MTASKHPPDLIYKFMALIAAVTCISVALQCQKQRSAHTVAPETNASSNRAVMAPRTSMNIGQNKEAMLDVSFNDLVDHHRSAEIRTEFKFLASNGSVGLEVYPMNPKASTLILATNEQMRSGSFAKLGMQEEFLVDSNYSRNYREIVLLHEWTHIKQIRENRFVGLPVDRQADGSQRLRDTRNLHEYFFSEAEAFEACCKFAILIDSTDEVSVCNAYRHRGRAGMLRAMAEEYCHSQTLAPACGELRRHAQSAS